MSAAGVGAPHRCLRGEKRFKNGTSSLTPKLLSPLQPPPPPPISRSPATGYSTTAAPSDWAPSTTSFESRDDGWCVTGDVGRAKKGREGERGVSTRSRQRHHMTSQHEFCFRACVEEETQTVRHPRSRLTLQLSRGVGAYGLVEGLGLGSQVLRLCHKVIQLLPSLQQTLHGVVLR